MTSADDYALLDAGDGRKLERFGPWVLERPCAQAAWRPQQGPAVWERADATFSRQGRMQWVLRDTLPEQWVVTVAGQRMKLSRTDFGHLGLFPEQRPLWIWSADRMRAAALQRRSPLRVLNLFAYSGGASIAAARTGAEVCHVDASKGMVGWARDNAALNNLQDAPIRWIVDDAVKFLRREIRRGSLYDAIILDPPTFGRGARGEVYKIERALQETLECCAQLRTAQPLFVLLSSHTPGFTPIVLQNLLRDFMGGGAVGGNEMLLTGAPGVLAVPSGGWAWWTPA